MRIDICARRPAGAWVTLLVSMSTGLIAQPPNDARNAAAGLATPATHILGLEKVSRGASGHLSIQAGGFLFQQNNGPAAEITIASIQSVFVGEQDRQVGGVPMALGQAATPFGGGRVIGLFSHKKFDTVTVQYLDPDGGLHGAVFQLGKGEGKAFKDMLQAEGAQVGPGVSNETK